MRADQAEQRYTEALQAAVAACAADTEGQTCFICLDGNDEEGLVRMCACRGGNGFAHVSCLARQAHVAVVEAERRRYDDDAFAVSWGRWFTCRLCEQNYHGVVRCALGWACWKTYLGRPEWDWARKGAMTQLANGLTEAEHHEDAMAVLEAVLSMQRRIGAHPKLILISQNHLANSYARLGRSDEVLRMRRDVYSGHLRLNGEDNYHTLQAAYNYACSLIELAGKNQTSCEEARSLIRTAIPISRRVLGEDHHLTLQLRKLYAFALYDDPSSTLDDYREAVATLEDVVPIARRVFGGAHPTTKNIETNLRDARETVAYKEVISRMTVAELRQLAGKSEAELKQLVARRQAVEGCVGTTARVAAFAVGRRVEARWAGGREWYPGKITAVRDGGGAYKIRYDDGVDEDGVAEGLIRVLEDDDADDPELAALRDSATATPSQPAQGNSDAADALSRALDVPRATAADALRRANGDRDAAAAMILEQRQPAPPLEAEVLSWDNPIEATLVEEPRPEPRPRRRSLSKRISDLMRGRRRGRL